MNVQNIPNLEILLQKDMKFSVKMNIERICINNFVLMFENDFHCSSISIQKSLMHLQSQIIEFYAEEL